MPITPADEQLLQAVFDWARRLFRRKGLTEHDAEDCAAEVRLPMLAHLKQGRTLSFAYAVRVAQGVLADFVQAQQRQPPAIPLKVPLPAGDADLVPLTQWGRPVGEGHNH